MTTLHIYNISTVIYIQLYINQMTFRAQEFRNAIADNDPRSLLGFVKKVIFNLRRMESVFLVRTMAEVATILRDQGEPPTLKFKTTKFLMYLVFLADNHIYDLIKQQVYTIIRSVCLFNRSQPLRLRGAQFFRNNQVTELASYEQKIKIKDIGCRYLVFCMEFVNTMAKIIPNQSNNKKQNSLFYNTYQTLVRQGVVFPSQDQLVFFTQKKMEEIQEEIQICKEELDNMSSEGSSGLQKKIHKPRKIQNPSIEYLQRRLKQKQNTLLERQMQLQQKQKLIQQMRQSNSLTDLQRQSAIELMRQKQLKQTRRIEQYQKIIAQLTQEVNSMRVLLRNQSAYTSVPTQKTKNQTKMLQKMHFQIQRLRIQNQQLRMQIQNQPSSSRKSAKMSFGNFSDASNMQSPSNKTVKNHHNLRQLLTCNEHQEITPAKTKKVSSQQQFFQFKQAKDCFNPYFDTLGKQQQIRLKKSLFKSKQVLFKNTVLQIGTISSIRSSIQVDLTVIVTNLSTNKVKILEMKWQDSREMAVFQGKQIPEKKIKPGQQSKVDIRVQINNIDARCIVMVLTYQQQQSDPQKLALILPISKFKLIKTLPYTAPSSKNQSFIEKVFTLDRRVMNSLDKLKSYFPRCYVSQHLGVQQFNIKIAFLQKTLFAKFVAMQGDSVRLSLRFNQQNRCLADKIMNQVIFILAK